MNEEKILQILLGEREVENSPKESGVFIFNDPEEFIIALNKLMEVIK